MTNSSGSSHKHRNTESTFDLNLAPMMDIMVVIIPFLLLSAVFMQMMVIDMPLPQPVAKAIQEDRNKKDRDVVIQLNLSKAGVAQLVLVESGGKTTKLMFAATGLDFSYDQIHKKLVEVKLRYPKIFRIEINPDDGVQYKKIVSVMDAARMLVATDPKVIIEDTEKKEKAETNLLFPDVVLANLM